MKLEPKYEIGQTVYDRFTGKKLKIIKIMVDLFTGGPHFEYYCDGADGRWSSVWLSEDDLVTEYTESKTVYDLEKYDLYYVASDSGEVKCRSFADDEFDKKMISFGNAFITWEAAEKELERRRIHQNLKRLSKGYAFKDKNNNFYITYCHHYDSIVVESNTSCYCPGIVYFASADEADEAVEIIGEETLARDYFGIKEGTDNDK